MQFAHFDPVAFRRDHWQRHPLLIRNPWRAWANPLDPDDLAGLACDADVESRLIVAKRKGLKLDHGPFEARRFAKLGKHPWTLLVQAVDHAVPAVAALLDAFRFLPNWRIDDVMVSYASDGGGVGPHFDQYDVFLIQGLGRRLWQVGGVCDHTTPLLPHDDLRLLSRFEPTQEWLLEPGDVLYLPPGIAHNGIAVGGDCMTYSIGCRAPSRAELIAGWSDHVLEQLSDDDRYADPGLQAQANAGEITADAIAKLYAMLTEKLLDRAAFARWFGAYSSTPKYPDLDWSPEAPMTVEALRARLAAGATLVRNPASRFSFVRVDAGSVLLFVDGECFEFTGEARGFAERLCGTGGLDLAPCEVASAAGTALIARLYNAGSLAFAAGRGPR